jgi:hypothetical protein
MWVMVGYWFPAMTHIPFTTVGGEMMTRNQILKNAQEFLEDSHIQRNVNLNRIRALRARADQLEQASRPRRAEVQAHLTALEPFTQPWDHHAKLVAANGGSHDGIPYPSAGGTDVPAIKLQRQLLEMLK